MEHLFSPCTRLWDLFEGQDHLNLPAGIQELNLDVSTDELLSAEMALTYADLFSMLGNRNTNAWLTPHAAVAAREDYGATYSWEQLDGSCCIHFDADGKEINLFARSPQHLLEICNVVLRLLAASVVRSVILHKLGSRDGTLSNAPILAHLMEQCQSLKALKLKRIEMDEDCIRMLGDFSRPDLEIDLKHCRITGAAAAVLVQVLGRNQGPTKLDCCYVDNFVLTDGLRGNSSLKRLTPRISSNLQVGNRELIAIAGALRENKGLVELNLRSRWSNETSWGAICDSLETHPTLEVLTFQETDTFPDPPVPVPPAVLKSRVQAIVDMMKMNISIHTIRLATHYEVLVGPVIIPYLETNRFRPRVRAVQKTRPIAYRVKVMGRALLAVRTDPNRFWMLLSGNADVAFPPTTASTAPATDLLTPATAAAPVNVATVTASATATSNVVAPAAGQKRKQCP
jgi:hypothetical protein